MRRNCFGLLLLLFSTQAWAAAADYTLIQDLLGTYKLLEWNGEASVAGTLTIFANDNGVGIKVKPMAMASTPAPDLIVSSPKQDTTLVRETALLRQDYHVGETKIRLEYHISDGYLEIYTESCVPGQGCSSNEAIVTRGGAPGTRLENRDFLSTLVGTYTILKAGGHVPKAGTNSGDVDGISDPSETAFYFPYCMESGACDAGYVGFPYVNTRVFRRTVGLDVEIFYLLVGEGNDAAVYSWEKKTDHVVFRNFQYPINGEIVCLEYQLQKKQDEILVTAAR